jgi:F0F1-type ATP synthase assembly protein I
VFFCRILGPGFGSCFVMADDRENGEKKNWVKLANYAQLAILFPAATVVGWLIGAALDRWLHTTWISIVGLILGIVAGFVEFIRTATKKW